MDEARARDLAARCVDPGREAGFLFKLRAQAEARLDVALAAYLHVRGTGRSVIPPHAWGSR